MRAAVLDLGGTVIKSGMFHGAGLGRVRETPSEAHKGADTLLKNVLHILKDYEPFDMIGISTAGTVDSKNGSIIFANDNIPGYTGVNVRDVIGHEFDVPIAVENDVNAAAVGELYFGAGVGVSNFLCLTYGTGVGGAMIANGDLYRGETYLAGAAGGIIIHPEDLSDDDPLCGCYERCASTSSLVRRVSKIYPELDSGKKIFSAAVDASVKEQIDLWLDDVSYGLVSLIHFLNPGRVILGGGVMERDDLPAEIKKRTVARLQEPFKNTEIVQARLGNRAGLYGAGKLAQLTL